ncbi:ATP-dependent DNA helicase RecG [Candidatus Parcubacteria bacterium]|nr:MAG: ATP-dependent DNA helicase RecG [Candidatus Parcubacteria bacterium]
MTPRSQIAENFNINPRQAAALKKLGLKTIEDLLFYFPTRYESFSERKNIVSLAEGDKTTVFGEVLEANIGKTWKKKMAISEISIGDNTGILKAVWFHQPYMAKIITIGDKIALTGKVSNGKGGLYMSNPSFEKITSYEALGEGAAILPVYPETYGITSRWLRFVIQKSLIAAKDIADPIPPEILKKYKLPSLKSALIYIQKPNKLKDAEAARKRFAFEEVFFIQMARLKQRQERQADHCLKLNCPPEELNEFVTSFPFQLTEAQKKAVAAIQADVRKEFPMSRLLEGDVGSGKTAVAIAATFMAVSSGYQVAYMAPTEILAAQHFSSFIEYFSQLKFRPKIGLLTSSDCRKYPSKVNPQEATKISKAQLLKWVENGEIPILIGTHALIEDKVKFCGKDGSSLALVIIDEQHRFGTAQRSSLAKDKSGKTPHLLSMTATPIPRTLALTIYGDLDLTLLDQLPEGRKPVITKIFQPEERESAYATIRSEIETGRQAYIICPRVDEPDPEKEMAILAKSVKEEAKRLKEKIFPEFEIDILHGKMLPKEKEEALLKFKENKSKILVATSVIEVGINVPNATIILIEGAERFGLAQLHQLRGRVIRGRHQPYCLVFAESRSQKTMERLKAFISAKNGFELAEYDLAIRGSGELGGGKQWGISDLGMEALKNLKMVEAARTEAQKIIANDPKLKNFPMLLKKIEASKRLHFE